MALMPSIRDFRVPECSMALWWLGQNSFILKTPGGALAGVDLYLTDSCAGLREDLDLRRSVPVMIEPEDLDIGLFVCTHNHQDHTDPETIRRLRNKTTMLFAGPHPSCEVFAAEGVAAASIHPAWPGSRLEYEDLTVHGVFALPTDDTDLNHLGYVLSARGGPSVYITGDTDDSDLLASARRHKPDAMIVCINGNFNNLSHWEAARLAARIRPRIAIPCHYDLFRDNAADPRQFEAALKLQAPEVICHVLEHGKPYVLTQGT